MKIETRTRLKRNIYCDETQHAILNSVPFNVPLSWTAQWWRNFYFCRYAVTNFQLARQRKGMWGEPGNLVCMQTDSHTAVKQAESDCDVYAYWSYRGGDQADEHTPVYLQGMTFPFLSDRNPLWTYLSQTAKYFLSLNCSQIFRSALLFSLVSNLCLLPVLNCV